MRLLFLLMPHLTISELFSAPRCKYPQSLENVNPDQNTNLTHVSRTTICYYENEDKKIMKWGETKWRTDALKPGIQKLTIKRNKSKETRKTGNEGGE